jgi:hypothetical protein
MRTDDGGHHYYVYDSALGTWVCVICGHVK